MSLSYLTSEQHKANARRMLGNNVFSKKWLMSALILFVVEIVTSALTASTYGVVELLISGFVNIGISFCFINLSRNGEIKFSQLWRGIDTDLLGNFLLGIMYALIITLWTLLLIIPGIVKSYAYSMAFYIKNDNPDWGWRECLNESEKIMKGNKYKLFHLDLTLLGWLIVSILTLGITLPWVGAYIYAAHTSFYEEIKTTYYVVG